METIFDFIANYLTCWWGGAITLLLMDVELWYVLPLIIALIPAAIMTKQQQIERQIDELTCKHSNRQTIFECYQDRCVHEKCNDCGTDIYSDL